MKVINERFCARAAWIGLLLTGAFAGPRADAAWDFVPDLNIRAQEEDNPFYIPDNLPGQKNASSAVVDMAIDMATYNQRSLLLFVPRVTAYRYSDSAYDPLNGEDWRIKGSGQYKWTTVTAGFDVDFRYQRIVTGEFGTVDYNLDTQATDTGDTGRTAFPNQYRKYYYLTPYVTFTLSPRNSLRLDVTQSDVSYTGSNVAFRTGFSDTRYSATLQRNTDQQTQISAIMSVEDYMADINANDFHTVTVQGQFSRPINQLWSFYMDAGVLRSDYQVANTQDRVTAGATTDYIVSLGFKKRTERMGLNADVGRNVFPSSNGYSVVRREARVYGDVDMSQRLGLEYAVWLQETKTLGGLNTADDRNYVNLELDFSWAIKPVLFLVTGVGYQTQEFVNAVVNQGKTNATTFNIGVRYRGLSKRKPPRPFAPPP